jgi:hypothetical protein
MKKRLKMVHCNPKYTYCSLKHYLIKMQSEQIRKYEMNGAYITHRRNAYKVLIGKP